MKDKWKKIQEISHFLQTAPKPAVVAWKMGWKNIVLFPRGFVTIPPCGCCEIKHAPGWYGDKPIKKDMYLPQSGICGIKGETGSFWK